MDALQTSQDPSAASAGSGAVRSGELVADREPAHEQRKELGLVGAGGVIDAGHKYKLLSLDGTHDQELRFVKRCDAERPWRFPGNTDSYPGTTLQSVIRALIDRVGYLQWQIWCPENAVIRQLLRACLWLLESRAARRHGRSYHHGLRFASEAPMCPECGHTVCEHSVGGGGAEQAGDGNATTRSRAGSATTAISDTPTETSRKETK